MNNEISSSGNAQAADGCAERPPLRTVAELPDGVAPPEVPADYIVTPFGYYPPESVHEIGLDEMSADTVQLKPAGKDKGQSVNKRPSYPLAGRKRPSRLPDESCAGRGGDLHFNVEAAIAYYSAFPAEEEEDYQKISSFSANLTVPTILGVRKEAGNDVEVLVALTDEDFGIFPPNSEPGIASHLSTGYFWPAEWHWGVAYWFIGDESVYHTRALKVDPGDKIHMKVKLTGTAGADSEKVYRWMFNCTVTSGRGIASCTVPFATDSLLNHIFCPSLWMDSLDVPPSEGKIEATDIMAFDENGDMLDLYSNWQYEHSSLRHDHDTPNVLFEKTGSPMTASNITLSWSPPLSVKD